MLSQAIIKTKELYNKGLYSQAITTLLTSDLDGDEPLVNYYLGLCYLKSGDYVNGREYLENFVAEDDNLLRIFQTNMLIAYSSIKIQDFKEAERTLKNLLESGFESGKLYSLLGYTYYKKGILAKSILYYRKAISIESDNATALNSLGYLLSDFPEDLKEAESLCRRALSINVNNAAYLDSLGWVCYKKQNLKASETFLNRALKLAPDNSEIKLHLDEVTKLGSSK